MTEIAYVISRICQEFESVEERSGEVRGSVGYRTDVILTPVKAVKIGLIPTKKA
jgi:hypothetical protein